MSPLQSGRYIIRNASARDQFIGRWMVEDRSLNPKRVVVLPTDVRPPVWMVEALPNNRYILRIGKAPTGTHDRRVFAFLLPDHLPEEWVIRHQAAMGHDAYTIEAPNGQGWILPDPEPETQVAVHHLIVLPTEPPRFPPNEIWIFEPVPVYDDDDE